MAVGKGIDPSSLLSVEGIRLGVCKAGIRYKDRLDLAVVEIAEGSSVAATFTKNQFCAAPVHVAKANLAENAIRYLLVNTGNANAGTGQQGMLDAELACSELAKLTAVDKGQIMPFSTGVIGEYLPMPALISGLPAALHDLDESHWDVFSKAILTTDTRVKGASEIVELSDGTKITITGVSKGSGMICPNMATMLAYIATDATIEQAYFQLIHKQAIDSSFNRITVDGDTSTNDACVGMATNLKGAAIKKGSLDAEKFSDAYARVALSIAQQIVRDGEGATKFVAVTVKGCSSSKLALDIAYTVAHSPLVKTALTASDANWGRILAAVGRAPGIETVGLSGTDIFLNDVCIVANGELNAKYKEADGAAVFALEELTITININQGEYSETVWTTDLSHEYVSINADYRS